jgi:hypothetical protein
MPPDLRPMTAGDLHPTTCLVCGEQACIKPSFCAACCKADASAQAKYRHGLSINGMQQWGTPKTTVEAVMYAVRARGIASLKEPANFERLSRCDAAGRAEINQRIARLIAAKVIAT